MINGDDPNISEVLSDKIMDLADLLGQFPRIETNKKAWEHLLIYAPKELSVNRRCEMNELLSTINFLLEIKKDELVDRDKIKDYKVCVKLEHEIGILEYLVISAKNINQS